MNLYDGFLAVLMPNVDDRRMMINSILDKETKS